MIIEISSTAIPHKGGFLVKSANHVRSLALAMAKESGRWTLGRGTPEISLTNL